MQSASFLSVRRTSAFVVSLIVLGFVVALVGAALHADVYATHDAGTDPQIYGHVTYSDGTPVSYPNVKYCYDPGTFPPAGCINYVFAASDNMGNWWYMFPTTGYYRIWAKEGNKESQHELVYYNALTMTVVQTATLVLQGPGADLMMYGYVVDSGSPVSGADVRHCLGPGAPPDPNTCFPSYTALSDSTGYWAYPFPPTNYYYVFWAEKNGVTSQYEHIYYTGGQVPVPDLIVFGADMPPPGNNYPDLKVRDLTYSYPKVTGPEAGDVMGFSGTVENKGDSNAVASSSRLRIDIDNDGFWDVFPANVSTSALAADESAEPRWDDIWTAVLGTHAFEICADDTFAVVESDESNNCKSATFSVAASGVAPGTGQIFGYVGEAPNFVSGVTIEIYQSGGTESWSTVTDSGGFYSVLDLPLNWTYQVRAIPPDGSLPPDQYVFLSDFEPSAQVDFFPQPVSEGSFTLSGKVTSNTGAAISNGIVEARHTVRGNVFSRDTDSDGSYELKIECGTWELNVFPNRFDADWHYDDQGNIRTVFFDCALVSGSATENFTVTVTNATLKGRVLNPDGTVPLAGSVDVRLWDGVNGFGGTTDAQGYFTVKAQAGVYEIGIFTLAADYMAPQLGSVELFTGKTLDIGTIVLVAPDAVIEGYVRDESGVGVGNIRVGADVPDGPGYQETLTATDGYYRLPVVSGTWEVFAEAGPFSGYAVLEQQYRVTLVSGQTVFGIDFTAIKTDATITGRIVQENGAVVTGIDAWVFAESAGLGAPVSFGDGSFTLAVPAGSYTLNVWIAPEAGFFSRGSVSVSVVSGGTASVDIVVLSAADGGRIEGTFVDTSGVPVIGLTDIEVFAGAEFNWIPGSMDSATGQYSVAVPPGTWYLGYEIITSDDFGESGQMVGSFTLSVGQVIVHDIVLTPSDATIIVTVLKSDGSVFPYVGTELSSVPFSPDVEFDVFADGFFRFGDTDANGVVSFRVPSGTYYATSFAPLAVGGINPPEQAVTVASGGIASVTLQYRTASATITGRVVLEGTGVGVPDAFVGGWSPTGGFAEGRSGADGNYVLNVASGDVWYVVAMGNVGGVFYESSPALVDLTTRESADQTLVLGATNFLIPPPLATTHDTTQPFSATLDNGTKVSAPANCFGTSGDVSITISPDIDAPDQGGLNVIGIAYNVEARRSDGTLVQKLNADVIISIPYDDADIIGLGVNETDLQLAFFDENNAKWQLLSSSIADTEANVVTATSRHLTRFAIVTPAYAAVVAAQVNEGDIIRGPDAVKVYIVNANGYKRHIFNPVVFDMYGHLRWDGIKEVSQATLDSYVTSDLYRASEDPKVYSLEEVDEAAGSAIKHWIDLSAEAFVAAGYDWNQVFVVNPVERDYYETGTPIQ